MCFKLKYLYNIIRIRVYSISIIALPTFSIKNGYTRDNINRMPVSKIKNLKLQRISYLLCRVDEEFYRCSRYDIINSLLHSILSLNLRGFLFILPLVYVCVIEKGNIAIIC